MNLLKNLSTLKSKFSNQVDEQYQINTESNKHDKVNDQLDNQNITFDFRVKNYSHDTFNTLIVTPLYERLVKLLHFLAITVLGALAGLTLAFMMCGLYIRFFSLENNILSSYIEYAIVKAFPKKDIFFDKATLKWDDGDFVFDLKKLKIGDFAIEKLILKPDIFASIKKNKCIFNAMKAYKPTFAITLAANSNIKDCKISANEEVAASGIAFPIKNLFVANDTIDKNAVLKVIDGKVKIVESFNTWDIKNVNFEYRISSNYPHKISFNANLPHMNDDINLKIKINEKGNDVTNAIFSIDSVNPNVLANYLQQKYVNSMSSIANYIKGYNIPLSGQIDLDFDKNFKIIGGNFNINAGAGSIKLPGINDSSSTALQIARRIEGANLVGKVTDKEIIFDNIDLRYQNSNIQIAGFLMSRNEINNNNISGYINGQLNLSNIAISELLSFLPDNILKKPIANFIKSISYIKLNKFNVNLNGKVDLKNPANNQKVQFSDCTFQLKNILLPVGEGFISDTIATGMITPNDIKIKFNGGSYNNFKIKQGDVIVGFDNGWSGKFNVEAPASYIINNMISVSERIRDMPVDLLSKGVGQLTLRVNGKIDQTGASNKHKMQYSACIDTVQLKENFLSCKAKCYKLMKDVILKKKGTSNEKNYQSVLSEVDKKMNAMNKKNADKLEMDGMKKGKQEKIDAKVDAKNAGVKNLKNKKGAEKIKDGKAQNKNAKVDAKNAKTDQKINANDNAKNANDNVKIDEKNQNITANTFEESVNIIEDGLHNLPFTITEGEGIIASGPNNMMKFIWNNNSLSINFDYKTKNKELSVNFAENFKTKQGNISIVCDADADFALKFMQLKYKGLQGFVNVVSKGEWVNKKQTYNLKMDLSNTTIDIPVYGKIKNDGPASLIAKIQKEGDIVELSSFKLDAPALQIKGKMKINMKDNSIMECSFNEFNSKSLKSKLNITKQGENSEIYFISEYVKLQYLIDTVKMLNEYTKNTTMYINIGYLDINNQNDKLANVKGILEFNGQGKLKNIECYSNFYKTNITAILTMSQFKLEDPLFTISVSNAGKMLEILGITSSVTDGDFKLHIKSFNNKTNNLDGKFEINDCIVQGNAILDKILLFASPVGIPRNTTIGFNNCIGNISIDNGNVVLSDVKALSPVILINANGAYDRNNDNLQMDGLCIPMKSVYENASQKGNKIFGANFKLNGSIQSPVTIVEPLRTLSLNELSSYSLEHLLSSEMNIENSFEEEMNNNSNNNIISRGNNIVVPSIQAKQVASIVKEAVKDAMNENTNNSMKIGDNKVNAVPEKHQSKINEQFGITIKRG